MIGPGRAASVRPSTRGDRLHLADGRREERLVGVVERVDRQRLLLARRCRARRTARARAHASRRAGSRLDAGGVQHDAVAHEEHVRARRLAQLALRVRRRSPRPRRAPPRTRARARSRRTRSSSARRARRARCASTARSPTSVVGGTGRPRWPRRSTVGGDAPRVASRRREPAGDGDAQPGLGEAVGREHRVGRVRAARRGRAVRARARRPTRASRSRCRRHANGSPVVDAHRLEHAVADDQAVVERRDARVVERRAARR